MGSLSCSDLPSIAAVVKTWIPGAVVVDLCFDRCALSCVALYCVRRESQNLRDARWTPSDRSAGLRFVWILPSPSVLLGPIVRRIVANYSLVVVRTPPSFSPSLSSASVATG